jgi:hypothetical protein
MTSGGVGKFRRMKLGTYAFHASSCCAAYLPVHSLCGPASFADGHRRIEFESQPRAEDRLPQHGHRRALECTCAAVPPDMPRQCFGGGSGNTETRKHRGRRRARNTKTQKHNTRWPRQACRAAPPWPARPPMSPAPRLARVRRANQYTYRNRTVGRRLSQSRTCPKLAAGVIVIEDKRPKRGRDLHREGAHYLST